jgi:hypothetical protein
VSPERQDRALHKPLALAEASDFGACRASRAVAVARARHRPRACQTHALPLRPHLTGLCGTLCPRLCPSHQGFSTSEGQRPISP